MTIAVSVELLDQAALTQASRMIVAMPLHQVNARNDCLRVGRSCATAKRASESQSPRAARTAHSLMVNAASHCRQREGESVGFWTWLRTNSRLAVTSGSRGESSLASRYAAMARPSSPDLK